MVKSSVNTALMVAMVLLLGSCDNSQSGNAGPIVLGDSTTILNEVDKEQLKDLVTDLTPVIPPAEDPEETPRPEDTSGKTSFKPLPAETGTVATTTAPAPAAVVPDGPGLKAEFKEVTVTIPGLTVRQGGNADLHKAHGATYALTDGEINGKTLKVTAGVIKVSKRYQSVVILKSDMGDLLLESMMVTTGWEQIKSNGSNSYPITGLDAKSLRYYDADARDIRKAVQQAARGRRLSRSKTDDYMDEVKHLKSANQKPLVVVLRAAMWKIDGRDENGKFYSKQIRVDVPR